MAKRGRRGQSPEQQRTTGETRPSRVVVHLYPDHAARPDPADIPPPAGMSEAGQQIWREKVERYRRRGQKVDGFQAALRQYCETEAALIEAWGTRMGPTAALLNCFKAWAAEFHDTPDAARGMRTIGRSASGRFGNNGDRPR